MDDLPLYRDIMEGKFHPASEQENLKEQRLLIAGLNNYPEEGITYFGINNYTHSKIKGKLPDEKERLLEKLDAFIALALKKEPMYAVRADKSCKIDDGLYGSDFREFVLMN